MSQVTEQSVRFQTALASIKLIQASAVLDLTEDDFDFLTSNKVWIATDRSRARRCVEACVYRSEERFSRNAETDLVCRLLLEKKKHKGGQCDHRLQRGRHAPRSDPRQLQIQPAAGHCRPCRRQHTT